MGKWFTEAEFVDFEVRDRVAYITLNRPEKRNAMTVEMQEDVHRALREADDLNEVRCAVIQGAGKDFSAGMDLARMAVRFKDDAPQYDDEDYRGHGSFDDELYRHRLTSDRRVEAFKMMKPVIGKIHGHCLAGATDLIMQCDILIAADDARIGFPATRAIGSPPMHMWLYYCGPQWAKRMLFTGDIILGKDAAEIGLVMKSVPADVLDAEVEYLARRIALVGADLLSAHKRIVNLGLEMMGTLTLQRLAAENDARAHLSKAYKAFFDVVNEKGVVAAVRERDEPFGTTTASRSRPEAPAAVTAS
jgi:enoyl-CoA hydratase